MADFSFIDSLIISHSEFRPDWGYEMSGTQGGLTILKEGRPVFWRALFRCVYLRPSELSAILFQVSKLHGSLSTFFAYRPEGKYPAADPNGVILGASTVRFNTINVDNTHVSLKGLPANYVLTKGDMFSCVYGSHPSIALHIIGQTITANGSGITAEFEIAPALRAGPAVNGQVAIAKPYAEMMMVPGSYSQQVDGFTGQIQFECVQRIWD